MAEKLMEIKGVGIKTMSRFFVEIGDISRLGSPKELQKLAGLAMDKNSSESEFGYDYFKMKSGKRPIGAYKYTLRDEEGRKIKTNHREYKAQHDFKMKEEIIE